jgi:hypothetical protein
VKRIPYTGSPRKNPDMDSLHHAGPAGISRTADIPCVNDWLRRDGATGLPDPQVSLRRAGSLDRDPMTSKARRFIQLAVALAG